MKIRFSVTSFASKNTRIVLAASLTELGSWKVGIPLSPLNQTEDNDSSPSFWTVVVGVSSVESFSYKFVKGNSSEPPRSLQSDERQIITAANELILHEPICVYHEEYIHKENAIWEGNGKEDNRIFSFEPLNSSLIYKMHGLSQYHFFDKELNLMEDGIYCLPVAYFKEPRNDITNNEYSHTYRFYKKLKEHGQIHFNQVMEKLYVGSCPRRREHIEDLKKKFRISDIINFQTSDDIVENYPDEINVNPHHRTIENVYKLFNEFNIRYIWLPTTDMCSHSRSKVIAQAAFLLQGILQQPDCTGVYIHCNAGVGRSIACIAGYMHCCLDLPLRQVNLLVNSRRPVAFFDENALSAGKKDFESKFSTASHILQQQRISIQ